MHFMKRSNPYHIQQQPALISLTWLLGLAALFGGNLVAQQTQQTQPPRQIQKAAWSGSDSAVYQITPLVSPSFQTLESGAQSESGSQSTPAASDRRLPLLFPNSQPPLSDFGWQPATPSKQSNADLFGDRKRVPSAIQQVSFEDKTVAQSGDSSQKPTDTTVPFATPAPVDIDAPPVTTSATVEAQIKKLEKSPATDDVKALAQKHHQQSIELLRLADEASLKTAKLKAEIENGPQLIEETRKRLAEPAEKAEVPISTTATVAELEALRLVDEEKLMAARAALDAWEAKNKIRNERKPLLPLQIEKTNKQLAEAREVVPASDGSDQAIVDARKTEHQSLITLLERQVLQYQTERTRYSALNELFPLQRDLALRTQSALEKRSAFWRTALIEAGKRESVRQAAEARRALQEAHPALRDLAEQNAKLTEQRSKLQTFLADTKTSVAAVKTLADSTAAEFTKAKEKEERSGLTTAMGILLRNQRSHLPDELRYKETQRQAEADMTRLQSGQLPLEDERRKVGDPVGQAELLVSDLGNQTETSLEEIQAMAVGLLSDRQKYLNEILNDYDTCIKDLAELDLHCRSLVATTVDFRNYIDTRVLWIRSSDVAGLHTPVQALNGLQDIVNHIHVRQIGTEIAAETKSSPKRALLTAIVIALLLAMQSRFRHWITLLSKSGAVKSGPGLASTVGALGLTIVIASVWPAMMWLLGRSLTVHSTDGLLIACGKAMQTTAIVFGTIEAFRQMCRSNGIAELHLMWPVETVQSLHVRLVGLMAAGLPIVFAVCFVEHWNEGIWMDSLGRIVFIFGMCVLAISLRRIVRPSGHVLRTVLQENNTGLLFRTRHVWSLAITLAPLILAGLSIAGFQYTAEQLLVRVEATAWLFIALMAAFGLLIRRTNTARRQLAINQARQRRAAAVASEEKKERLGEVSPDVSTEQMDFSRLGSQVLKLTQIAACVLFAAGAWMVWAEVLPALQIFDEVELWSTVTESVEEVEIAEGVTKPVLVSQETPVSLGSFILACGLLGLFVVASRNLPGLLELSVLQHMPMDDGGRNAISTLCRYALFTTGIAWAANMLGIGWSSVQWLLAALTVGLGFGLQEIFANFVSGLIILFERPVRIGDVVTIDSVSGKVSRIQIRATTITDFDRKEYIVPNKEFVTGRVLNWTLSDKTNRIKIEVGVGYGQDTLLARELLMKVAKDNPKVLVDPAPLSTFEGFGDSCLNLSLRCFIAGLDDRLQVITDLHESIDREFKKQNLEIAFPQRDIHIRTMAAVPSAVPTAMSDQQSASESQQAGDHGESRQAA